MGHTVSVVFGRYRMALFAVVLAVGSAVVAGEPPVTIRDFTGTARNPKNQDLLYTEHHHQRLDHDGSVAIETVYRDPTGAIIASRSVRLPASGYLPTYHFRDERTGYEEGIRRDDGGSVMFRKRPGRDAIDEKVVSEDGAMVADAGFDRLVALNWQRLVAGDRVDAVLVVPSRMRGFRLSVIKVGESMIEGIPVMTLRMSFSNPLLRLLAPKLLVSYHREEHVIVAFEGKSALEDPAGGNYTVSVSYTHAGDGR